MATRELLCDEVEDDLSNAVHESALTQQAGAFACAAVSFHTLVSFATAPLTIVFSFLNLQACLVVARCHTHLLATLSGTDDIGHVSWEGACAPVMLPPMPLLGSVGRNLVGWILKRMQTCDKRQQPLEWLDAESQSFWKLDGVLAAGFAQTLLQALAPPTADIHQGGPLARLSSLASGMVRNCCSLHYFPDCHRYSADVSLSRDSCTLHFSLCALMLDAEESVWPGDVLLRESFRVVCSAEVCREGDTCRRARRMEDIFTVEYSAEQGENEEKARVRCSGRHMNTALCSEVSSALLDQVDVIMLLRILFCLLCGPAQFVRARRQWFSNNEAPRASLSVLRSDGSSRCSSVQADGDHTMSAKTRLSTTSLFAELHGIFRSFETRSN